MFAGSSGQMAQRFSSPYAITRAREKGKLSIATAPSVVQSADSLSLSHPRCVYHANRHCVISSELAGIIPDSLYLRIEFVRFASQSIHSRDVHIVNIRENFSKFALFPQRIILKKYINDSIVSHNKSTSQVKRKFMRMYFVTSLCGRKKKNNVFRDLILQDKTMLYSPCCYTLISAPYYILAESE